MSTISQLNTSLYFNLNNSFIYINTGNTGALNLSTINGGNEIQFLTINSLSGSLFIPSETVLEIQNATITNLTSVNNTGVIGNITGPAGINGVQGYQGNQGYQGLIGLQGLQGSQGFDGNQGNQGLQSLQGLQGNQGFQGFQGLSFSVTNFGAGRLTTSMGTSYEVMAHTGLTFSSNLLTVGGNVSPTGVYVQSIKSLTGGTGTIDTTRMVNLLPGNAFGSYATRISGTFSDIGYGIAVDTDGNSYVTGYYSRTGTVYNSDGTAFVTLSGSGVDCFVVKFGPTGMGSYATRINGFGNNTDIGYGIAVDTSGNSYVTGLYVQPATVYNSDGTVFATLNGSGNNDCFVVKYGPTGMGSYSTKISGVSSDEGRGIGVDTSGNSYVTGVYRQPATVYNSDGTAFATLSGSGLDDCFVVKYGPTGMGDYVTRISGTSFDYGQGIAVDGSGNSYVIGSYIQPAIVYNSDGTAFSTISGSGANDCFVVKYGPTGMGSYVTKIGGTSTDLGYGITVDGNGNSYVTGYFTSTGTVYNSDGTSFATLMGSGLNRDCFIVKYGTTGMGTWVAQISGINNDEGRGIAVDTSGNSYVTGYYTNTGTVYNSDGTAFVTLSGSGLQDCFIVKYGPTGMGSWVTKISGTSADIGYGIAVDTNGNSYVTGFYTGTGTIYNSDGSAYTTLSGSGNSEAFVVKYSNQYNLTDLSNDTTNYGKSVNLVNQYQPSQSTVNLKTVGGTTYGTYTVDNAKTFVFNNGQWYPSVNL